MFPCLLSPESMTNAQLDTEWLTIGSAKLQIRQDLGWTRNWPLMLLSGLNQRLDAILEEMRIRQFCRA